ncbi:MAG: sigma-54 dependent transcriptional regulator [bacterium]
MANILIIDDDLALCKMLSQMVKKMTHQPRYALTIQDGLRELAVEMIDVVYLDVGLPDGNGLDFIPQIKSAPSAPEVVIITGKGERNGAEMAIRNGAWDYLKKPFSINKIALQLTGILKYRQEKTNREKPVLLKRDDIIGSSAEITECLRLVIEAAESDANVLITGETGTGKELFARAIHRNSRRARENFVVVDCGALTESLVGSILFGHEKGAFTGAERQHEGLIKQADKGTLFLDEVGELPISNQSAFLRGLQEHKIRPLGSASEIESDFRLVTATNRNLEQLVEEEKIRKDLLYRLQTISIDLPPLRHRKSDIKDLVIHYINRFCERYHYESKGFSQEFIEMMMAYDWPGNVRELANAVEKAVCSAREDNHLYPIHLPALIRIYAADGSPGRTVPQSSPVPPPEMGLDGFVDLKDHLKQVENQYLNHLIASTRGDIKQACLISGLSRSRLYERLKTYGIKHKLQ